MVQKTSFSWAVFCGVVGYRGHTKIVVCRIGVDGVNAG